MTTEQQPGRLEAFDYTVALVLARLFESFPERVQLSGMRLVVDTAVENDVSDKIKEAVPSIVYDTVVWLRDEGFIRYQSDDMEGDFTGVTLSLRGLTILGYVPVSLKDSPSPEPIIAKLHGALKSGGTVMMHEVIKQAIGKGFGLLAGVVLSGGSR
jgi:hypothetical protein